MRKVLCVLLVLLSLWSCAFAEGGVFVPDYNTFMDSFSEKLKATDKGLHKEFVEDHKENGEWVSFDSNVYIIGKKPYIHVQQGAGFLNTYRMAQERKDFADSDELFKQLMLESSLTICPDLNVETFFDDICYDYVVDSPASYITTYYNCGVYLFNFTKTSREMEFEIRLSVYEAQ